MLELINVMYFRDGCQLSMALSKVRLVLVHGLQLDLVNVVASQDVGNHLLTDAFFVFTHRGAAYGSHLRQDYLLSMTSVPDRKVVLVISWSHFPSDMWNDNLTFHARSRTFILFGTKSDCRRSAVIRPSRCERAPCHWG